MSLVWEHYPSGGGELLTALAYADHAHDDGTSIYPSVGLIARKTRQGERTIQMHLAAMRASGWLLTVRYATGGRCPGSAAPKPKGRPTEYRINPAWIAKPAEFAPFSKAPKRVRLGAGKGAIDSPKGCKAFAPEPPRTVSEPTTTCGTGNDLAVVVSHDELIWPTLFNGTAKTSAAKVLQDCPHADRQNVLDEIAGRADRGPVWSPIGLLRRLVECAGQGKFVPAAALDYQQQRQFRTQAIQAAIEEEQRREQQSTPLAREAARMRLAVARQQLIGRPTRIDAEDSP